MWLSRTLLHLIMSELADASGKSGRGVGGARPLRWGGMRQVTLAWAQVLWRMMNSFPKFHAKGPCTVHADVTDACEGVQNAIYLLNRCLARTPDVSFDHHDVLQTTLQMMEDLSGLLKLLLMQVRRPHGHRCVSPGRSLCPCCDSLGGGGRHVEHRAVLDTPFCFC